MTKVRIKSIGLFTFLLVLLGLILTGCTAPQLQQSGCARTEPTWIKPPEDPAVSGSPEPGYYYINEDASIWASAWWFGEEKIYLRAGDQGVKLGWFRPSGAELEIVGKRIDGNAPPLESHVPCCYPTRFQAAGLMFPSAGCWEITASAEDRVLTFVVSVAP
jgi:hypothetical protein